MIPLDIFILFILFLLGVAIGSLLNVLALRYGSGRKVANDRSVCLSCGEKLSWRELVPVLSYLQLRGRCKFCKSRISIQYPLVEILTGAIFLLAGVKYMDLIFTTPLVGFSALLLGLVFLSTLIFIVIYDIKQTIIPNKAVYILIAISLIYLFFDHAFFSFDAPEIYHILSGPILFLFLGGLWFVSSGRWMGLGDAKLVLSFGWALGMAGGISALIYGFWLGALWAILYLIFNLLYPRLGKELSLKSEIPFAPFLIAGFLIIFFTGFDIWHLILLFTF